MITLEEYTDCNFAIPLTWRNFYFDKFNSKQKISEKEHKTWYKLYRRLRKIEYEVMYLAMQDGVPVGSLGLTKIDTSEAEVSRVVVNPDYTGTGCMKQAMRELFKKAKERNIERLYLDVLEDNTHAIEFYTRLGFVQYDRRDGSIYMDIWLNR